MSGSVWPHEYFKIYRMLPSSILVKLKRTCTSTPFFRWECLNKAFHIINNGLVARSGSKERTFRVYSIANVPD